MQLLKQKIRIFKEKNYENTEEMEDNINNFLKSRDIVDIKPVVTGKDGKHIDIVVVYND